MDIKQYWVLFVNGLLDGLFGDILELEINERAGIKGSEKIDEEHPESCDERANKAGKWQQNVDSGDLAWSKCEPVFDP